MEVKSLLVKFGTDTKAMEAGFQKADGLIQKHSEKFKKAGRAMTVAGAAIVGSIGLMVKSYVAAGDEVHKMALRTSFSTEALSELKYAAEISGASLADVEKGIKKMSKTIVDASDGLTTYVRAFDRIGLTAEELMALSPEEQFDKISQAIARVENPTIRAAAAQDIFGRAGTKLLPLFAEGEKGLEALRAKAREMGIVFDQEAANKAAALNDAMTTLKGSFKGVTMAIAEQLTPIIEGLADKITNIVIKAKDWIKENPKLAGVLMKVVAAVGILLTILGPILIILPALSTGFIILWGAITGPVGLVIAAVAAVAGAAYLIYKNWEPIKEFFIGLWEDVSGFFVNAFNSIKAKVLDWAISIAGILEKIPIAKKLAGPWKESLESMRAEMDKTVVGISEATAQMEADAQDLGQVWYNAIQGTTLFKNAVAAAKEETGLLNKILAVSKVGISAWSEGFGKASEDVVTTVAKANEKITGLVKSMVDEIKKATMDEYEYSKWALGQKLADRIATIEAEKASEDEKNKAIAAARASFNAEDAALDKAHKDAGIARDVEAATKKTELLDQLKAEEKAWKDAHLTEQEALRDSINQLEMDKFTYASWALDQKYAKEKETSTNLLLLWEEYQVQKKVLADAARAEEDAARKQSLENTLADISSVLNQIGGLFRMSFDNKMALIDQEEERRLEAINAQYDAQIAALQGIVAAEEAKTQEVLDSINREYDDKRQHILDNLADNEDRDAALEALEQEREDRLAQALIDREIAEQSAADALVAMEDAKDTALEDLAKDLEIERSKERKKAAKQEKAVALLAAIVNTAAAISKALPNIPLAIAVGILGAIQIAIIKAQPLPLKAGGVVMRPTQALIGEAGPEAVIPLNKLSGGFMQPAPVYVKQSNYFYGDINNSGDLDEISERLARRTVRMIERGRRS